MTPAHKLALWWGGGALLLLLLFGNQGFRNLCRQMSEKKRISANLAALRAEHERLTHELGLIQQDPSHTEYLVRKTLGYVKKGEIEYHFVAPEKQKK